MTSFVRIGGANLNQIPIDWKNNLHNIISVISEAKSHQVNILCLPELCISGYGCEDLFLSEWLPAKALEKLLEIVPYCTCMLVTVGLPMRYYGNTYNVACVIADGKIAGFYVKHHLAGDGVHYEPRWFTSWPQNVLSEIEIDGVKYPFGAFTLSYSGLKIGFEICEDAWRKDRPACLLKQSETQVILNPSASHFAFGKAAFRKQLVAESSREFECVYVYTNLLGNESGRMIFDGDIMIAQHGKMLALQRRLSFRDTNLLYTDVCIEDVSESYENVQSDFTTTNEEFGRATTLALFDYLRKSKSHGFVLSLSGGADSSTIAILVAEMVRNGIKDLGVDAFILKLKINGLQDLPISQLDDEGIKKMMVGALLHTAYQGTVNSSDATFTSAKYLAESIGAKFSAWSINEEVESYSKKIENVLGRSLNWKQDDIALQNIQARARSPIIWMLANIKKCLLLSTSNRSEGDVGYATMDGDTSGSISPIAAVDKHFIIQWLKYAEECLGYHSLKYVNSLAPTAELRPAAQTQTDESDLMPYSLLVQIERLAIRDRKSPIDVFESLKGRNIELSEEKLVAYVIKFYKLWSINQWKRERLAPSFHLDDFNVDPKTWCRFPILSSGFDEELQELLSHYKK